MAKKSSRTADARSVVDNGEGMMAALVDRIFENPANSGGLVVVALTATAIVSNAMFLQPGHRSDFLAPRPAAQSAGDAPPAPFTVPLPRPSPARVQPPAGEQPVEQQQVQHAVPVPPAVAAPVAPPAPAAHKPAALKPADQAALLTGVQRHLAELGLYTGAIDGKPGPRTSAAISAYERAAGLAPTGKATAALLATMQAPLPPAPLTAAPADPITADAGQQLDQRADVRQAAIDAEQKEHAEAQMHADTRMTQQALNNIGYGPLVVNGQPDSETGDAIRRFQLDNGMPLTGQADQDLIQRLKTIGAIQQPG